MYYNSNKNNNDYYTSYKQDMQDIEAYKKEGSVQKLLKLTSIILGLILFILGGMYLYKYFNPNIESSTKLGSLQQDTKPHKVLAPLVIREDELPKSIQIEELEKHSLATANTKTTPYNGSNISHKDIALIVQIIMSQMNTKKEMPLEEQLATAEKKVFRKHSLKESNHYNKVVIKENKEEIDSDNEELLKLSNSMNAILKETSANAKSTYLKSIDKEIAERKNAMRVIIVKQGDSLSKIAKKAYGSYDDYTKIFAANPEIIKNPNQIYVGQRLRIPVELQI